MTERACELVDRTDHSNFTLGRDCKVGRKLLPNISHVIRKIEGEIQWYMSLLKNEIYIV